MEQKSIEAKKKSSVEFQFLEGWVRGKIQEYIQFLLEEEVVELLRRQKWERKGGVDPSTGIATDTGRRGI